jgi:hypothetical protein
MMLVFSIILPPDGKHHALEPSCHRQVNGLSLVAVADFESHSEVLRMPIFDSASDSRVPVTAAESLIEDNQRICR